VLRASGADADGLENKDGQDGDDDDDDSDSERRFNTDGGRGGTRRKLPFPLEVESLSALRGSLEQM
jgi:hypothetical protein